MTRERLTRELSAKKDRVALITSIIAALSVTASLITGVAVAWADTTTSMTSTSTTSTSTPTTTMMPAPPSLTATAAPEITSELPEVDSTVVTEVSLNVSAAERVSTQVSARTLALRQIAKAKKPWGARVVAKAIAKAKHGWGPTQFVCLNNLWTRESGWRYRANNSRTGAYGIPQAHPGSKMSTVARDWRTNPVTQIRWGLRYIDSRYNTPCAAWAKFKRSNWY